MFMMDLKGKGIFMVFADVDPKQEEEFNAWYDTEHLSDVLAVPGVLSGARYTAYKGGPKYLAVYELSSSEVFTGPDFQKLLQEPTPWSQRMAPSVIGKNVARVLGQQIFPADVEMPERPMPPALQIGRMSVSAEIDSAWNSWYNGEYVPGYRKVPGVLYARRYRVVEGSTIYMTVYEFEDEKVSETDAWDHQRRTSSPRSQEMRQAMDFAPGSPGVYQRLTS
jgi:hypothetical protein